MKLTDLITPEELKTELDRPESEISGPVIPKARNGRPGDPALAMTAEQVAAIDAINPFAEILVSRYGMREFSTTMMVLQAMQVILSKKFSASNERMHETLRQGRTTHN